MVDISGYLTSGEKVLEEWMDDEFKVYATNNRIISLHGNRISDASYSQISSIEFGRIIKKPTLALGILLLVASFLQLIYINPFTILFGVALISWFIMFFLAIILLHASKRNRIMMCVNDQKPIEFSENMKPIIKWVEDYKVKIEKDIASTSEAKKKSIRLTKKELLSGAINALKQGEVELSKEFIQKIESPRKKSMPKAGMHRARGGVIPLTREEMLRNAMKAVESRDTELAIKFMELVKAYSSSKEKKKKSTR